MSKAHQVEAWADGDTVQVDEVRAELEALVGEMNGHLDSDNIDNALITGAKVAEDTFHQLLVIDDPGPNNFTRENSDPQRWFVVESGTLTTQDGMLDLDGELTYDTPSGLGAGSVKHCAVGIRVDGSLACSSAPSAWLESDSLDCTGVWPVGPGPHTIELVLAITPGEFTTAPTASLQITVNGRFLWAREMVR